MDKLKTDLYGGFPFELDDWRWEIEAHRRAIGSLGWALATLAGDWSAVILHGIVVTPGVATGPMTPWIITPGVLVIHGEVYEFGGGVASPFVSGNQLWLEVEEVPSPLGPDTFQDGSVQNTCIIRRVKLRVGPTPPAPGVTGVLIIDTHRIEDAMAKSGNWQPMPIIDPSFVAVGGGIPEYRFEPGGVVRLRGKVRFTGPTGVISPIVFVMPVGARPPNNVTIHPALILPQVGMARSALIAISPYTGEVEVNGLDPQSLTSGDTVCLDGVTYPVT